MHSFIFDRLMSIVLLPRTVNWFVRFLNALAQSHEFTLNLLSQVMMKKISMYFCVFIFLTEDTKRVYSSSARQLFTFNLSVRCVVFSFPVPRIVSHQTSISLQVAHIV